jgi:hypothetical protein
VNLSRHQNQMRIIYFIFPMFSLCCENCFYDDNYDYHFDDYFDYHEQKFENEAIKFQKNFWSEPNYRYKEETEEDIEYSKLLLNSFKS